MRNSLTVAAVVVFAVSTGLLDRMQGSGRPTASLPPAMAVFDPAAAGTTQAGVDDVVTSGIAR